MTLNTIEVMKNIILITYFALLNNTFAGESISLNIHFKAPEFSISGYQSSESVKDKANKKNIKKPEVKITNDYLTMDVKDFKNDEDLSQIVNSLKEKKEIKKNNKEYDDDGLVVYNYSEPSKVEKKEEKAVVDSIQTVASAPISKPLEAIIKREMNGGGNYKKYKKVEKVNKGNISNAQNVSSGGLVIKALEVSLDEEAATELIESFQVQTPFHEDQIYSSNLNGELEVNTQRGIFRGMVLNSNSVATKIELPVDREGGIYTIPLLTYDSLRNYLDKNKVEGSGGHYLVEVAESVSDVDIEIVGNNESYEMRVLFDENFNEVKSGDEFRYILFIGVNVGNVTVKTIGYNGEYADKISLISPDEVLFEYLEINNKKSRKFELSLNNTMSVVSSAINVESEKIKTVIGSGKNEKISESKYKYSNSTEILGMKSYMELDYLNDKVYFSIDSDKEINIPSNEFIGEVLTQFEIDAMEERCLIQINLVDRYDDISIAIESDMGFETSNILYLDKDGIFTDEISPMTKKVFILGQRQGIVSVNLKKNKINNYQRTFCSTATYLIEQL